MSIARSRSGGPAVRATVLGYPRIGPNRELKRAVEAYWAGDISAPDLAAAGEDLRVRTHRELVGAGLDEVPTGTFSFYDRVLDTALLFGVARCMEGTEVASREWFDRYFALARGDATTPAWEMTKWFDTNYHYLVPPIGPETVLHVANDTPTRHLEEAQRLGVTGRPVLIGPVTLLSLAKPSDQAPSDFDPLDRLDDLIPCYETVLAQLARAGAGWAQLDEPILACDLTRRQLVSIRRTYQRLGCAMPRPRLLVAVYFGQPYRAAAGDALTCLLDTPVDGLCVDLSSEQSTILDRLAASGSLEDRRLDLGIVNGRTIWRTDRPRAMATCAPALSLAGEVSISTSCSLEHVPVDLALERDLDERLVATIAFARQKVDEVVALAAALRAGAGTSQQPVGPRGWPPADPELRGLLAGLSRSDLQRASPADQRLLTQCDRLRLPILPTTTIGSFPQTAEVRSARAQWRAGTLTEAEYTDRMRSAIDEAIAFQEEIGLDVFVHGEPERNDMVQYFAEHLDGFAVTERGWVQSYGTRCVRPPILYGDVRRPAPITVEWSRYAQSRTDKPVKGMLTGPVTMLTWSFVRDDQPIADTANQVALALRDEIRDLEAEGIAIIQVDEPALREGLPLLRGDQQAYLDWAVAAFRLATSGVADQTQIHTHMCYSEFNDILDAVVALDADVTSVEAARSHMEIVQRLTSVGFAAGIGPGVYDIHSPRVPSEAEIEAALRPAIAGVGASRLWVNPDCGLKTRAYPEIGPALRAMVAVAARLRHELTEG